MIGPQGPSLTAAPTGSRLTIIIGAVQSGATDSEDAMRKHVYIDEELVRHDHDAGEDDARGNWPPAEPTVDSIRGRRVHRLPRRDRAARILARLAHVAAIRRARSPFSPGRRARLDQARRANSRVVNQLQRSQPMKEE